MNQPIYINSQDGILNSKSHDFIINFLPEIYLDKKKNLITLDSIDMRYSWYNVSREYKNNTFKFSKDEGVTWITVTLPNGNYSYVEITSNEGCNKYKNFSGICIIKLQSIDKI